MKTKKFVLLLFFVVLVFNSIKTIAQDWAPIGATWHYSFSDWYYPPFLISYSKIVSEKDTIINSVNCRKLINYKAGPNGTPNYYQKKIYMYETDKKVYYYVDSLSRFCLLYDFNANAGDWWILDEYSGSEWFRDTVKVISTDTIIINGHKRKTMMTQNSNFQVGLDGLCIEGIGNWYYMFPTFDMTEYGPLRCYQDNELGLYSTGQTPTCETTTIGIEEIGYDSKVYIYPNPCNDFINVQLKENLVCEIKIFSALNQMVYDYASTNNFFTIPTKQLPAGVYFILIINNNNIIFKNTLIKK